jgi:hypothetical protein
VNLLHRRGTLRPGRKGSLQWGGGASIGFSAEVDRLVLSYRVRVAGGAAQDVAQTIHIIRTPCRFGGERPFFLCPSCARRCTKLHGAGRLFLCRRCHGLAYESQREGEVDRLIRRAGKLRRRLGGEPRLSALLPRRPKGMWQRTYDRLADEIYEAENRAEAAFVRRLARG